MLDSQKIQQHTKTEIDPFTIPDDICRSIPFELIRTYQIIPIALAGNTLILASAKPLSHNASLKIKERIKRDIENILATQASIVFAMHVIARRTKQHSEYAHKPRSLMSPTNIKRPTSPVDFKSPHERLFARHAPFGKYLLNETHISLEELNEYLSNSISQGLPLGEYLVRKKIISADLRDSILEQINESYKNIFNDYFRELTESKRSRK